MPYGEPEQRRKQSEELEQRLSALEYLSTLPAQIRRRFRPDHIPDSIQAADYVIHRRNLD